MSTIGWVILRLNLTSQSHGCAIELLTIHMKKIDLAVFCVKAVENNL